MYVTYFTIYIAPYALHIIPIRHDAMLHRISYAKQAAMLLRLGTNKNVALQGAGHYPNMLWSANAKMKPRLTTFSLALHCTKYSLVGKPALWNVLASKAGFDHTGAL